MKKILLIIIFLILITGCSNDINEEIIVTSMYLDEDLTLLYIIPNEKDSYLESISSTGTNYDEMFETIKNKATQKLYLEHMNTIVVNYNISYKKLISFLKKLPIQDNTSIILANNIKKIIEEYIVLAPFTTPNVTLESKKIKTTTYKILKENKNTYLPLITYQDGTIFVGYKKIQP